MFCLVMLVGDYFAFLFEKVLRQFVINIPLIYHYIFKENIYNRFSFQMR